MPASPELTTLTALAQALGRSASLSESLDAALATVSELLGLETAWVWLLDERDADAEPTLAAARALPPALAEHPDAMRGDCHCLKTFRSGALRGAANVNVVWCTRLAKVVGREMLRYHASVPLTAGGRRLGMLNVASRDWRVLTEDELNLLATAGALVSLAVERSRLEAAGARAAAAEERNRLAREIHDTLAQGLAGLTMQLEVADALAPAGGPRLAAALSRALVLARATLDEARRSVLDLRAAPLDGRTLPQALDELVTRTRDGGAAGDGADGAPSMRVEARGFDGGDGALPPAVEVGLYRIAEQALANAARHAGAASVTVRLTRERERVRLRVEDDGAGFEPSAVPEGRFGLVGMGERARLLGGTLTVDSAAGGGGTVVEADVPLRPVAWKAP